MGLYPKELKAVLAGVPWGPNSNAYIVDVENGDDANSGLSWGKSLATIEAAYDLCEDNQNDVIVVVAGNSAHALAAEITWSKDFVHMIGLSANLPGVGQRARITASATVDAVQLITVSGQGNIFRNLQIANEADAAADSGAVVVTGNRNEFTNVFFHGILNAATVGIRAGAFSLKLTGAHENLFDNCTIGADTTVRASTGADLVIQTGSSKNTFRDCYLMSASETAGHNAVSFVTSTTPMGLTVFKNCLFYNNSVNWGQAITDVFGITGAQATYYIVLMGCLAVGYTGWSDVLTHVYSADPAPDTGFGIATSPAA